MSSSRSSDSCSSGRSNVSNKIDETIPLMLNQAHSKTYGSLLMYHFLKNTASPTSKMDKKEPVLDSNDSKKKIISTTKILIQQPTFDEDPCFEKYSQGDKDFTIKEGEYAKSFLTVLDEPGSLKCENDKIESSGSVSDDEITNGKRSRLKHQRSISLINESFSSEQTETEKNGESHPSRPRGMSLPHAHNSLDNVPQRRRGMSFLQINRNDIFGGGLTSFYNQLQNLTVPTISFVTPVDSATGSTSARKISFGLWKLSQTNLNRSDSMVSLSYRSIVGYIVEENLDGLKSYLDSKKFNVDDRDENHSTALIYAASKGKLDFVKELINYGADVNAEDSDNWTALLCAAKEGYTEICRELLDHGAAIDHREMGSWTALLWASYKGRTQVAELLIERGADVNAHENYHICPVHWACGRGHTDIVRMLLQKGVKVNVGDKYGTTALVWACRKGHTEIVEMLLRAGANVDTSGMYSWTPLLVAAAGNHMEVVNLLLEHKPNVNSLDKDGYTALALACKEGYYDIVMALLSAGAYFNIQDRAGDTNLILAVKGGHRSVVEALLKKYADIDTPGKDKKTALYTAVEKGNVSIVKLLLSANPDLEVTTKDGDTALLRAVRSRNAEIVQLLLDKKAKVSVTDKKGDTVLHIAMRARSKAIVEILLRNPKNSQLLYRPNRNGETPYNIDINQQKTILGQIFGARRLNTNEDNENMLGYDLYSSALADILSEPSLCMPITVGLYAKWGSGKSFLLNKLKEEMKNFARQWVDPTFKLSSLLIVTVFHITLVLALVVALASGSWLAGILTLAASFFLLFTFLIILWCCSKRFDWHWPYQASINLARRINSFRLVLQVIFCHPPGSQWNDSRIQPIRFNFTDQTRISTTTGGENSVVMMLGSLYDSIENDYGTFSTRMYRAFRPKCVKATSPWRWRKACCVPHVVIFEIGFFLILLEICLLAVYFQDASPKRQEYLSDTTLKILLITIGTLLAVGFVANLYTLSHLLTALIFSQRRQLQRTIARLETLKSEGFLQALKAEVALMTDMVKCLDSFTKQQTRLVVIVNGLDSCEQDKVLMVLDAIHMLFSDVNSPFIVILAIDPHIISKAVELNSRKLISETNVGGHEYLRNMVHLPFFLANSALRKVKIAQSTASKRTVNASFETGDEANAYHSSRRLSGESNFTSSMEKLKVPSRKSSRKLKPSDSIASSICSNLNKIGGAQDLTKMLLTDDYFSDVNPRSMRRLLNVVYVTGRLLKAFQMDFNWYHLAVWINITEQWPYRTSWLIWFYEIHEDSLDDQLSLKTIYDEVRPKIPLNKEIEPLLERDRDEKKFDIFLSYHRSNLLLSDLKIFLPFTINLDPYIKKVIKEDIQDEQWNRNSNYMMRYQQNTRSQKPAWGPAKADLRVPQLNTYSAPSVDPRQPIICQNCLPATTAPLPAPLSATSSLPMELLETRLSQRTVNGVCELIHKMQEIDSASAPRYIATIRESNINGKVLLHCDLEDLKKVLQMNFGDWEMFKVMIISLREHELSVITRAEETFTKNVRFFTSKDKRLLPEKKRENSKSQDTDKEMKRISSKNSSVENQVTLEDQMICGALQTLNEEACEDVLEESGEIGELAERRKEKFLNAHEPNAEDAETKSLLYLKNYEKKTLESDSTSSSVLTQKLSRQNFQQPHPLKPAEPEQNSDGKQNLPGKSQPLNNQSEQDEEQELLSGSRESSKRIKYKDNVVHVETQTSPYNNAKKSHKDSLQPPHDKSKPPSNFPGSGSGNSSSQPPPPPPPPSSSSSSSSPPPSQASMNQRRNRGDKNSSQNKKNHGSNGITQAPDFSDPDQVLAVKKKERIYGENDIGKEGKASKDTAVVFLQTSPLNQQYWQATTTNTAEDSSPPSSTCGTPVLQRRALKSNSHQGSSKNRDGIKSPPSRSRIPCDGKLDEHLRLDRFTPPASPKNFGSFSPFVDGEISRSKSANLFNFSSLKKKKPGESTKDTTPNLIVTPASSTEKIHKLKEKFSLKSFSSNKEISVNLENLNKGNYSLDNDENAPLVNEGGSFMQISDSDHNLYFKIKKSGIGKCSGSSGEVTPSSLPSSPETVTIAQGVSNKNNFKQRLLESESPVVRFMRQGKSSDNLYCDKTDFSNDLTNLESNGKHEPCV